MADQNGTFALFEKIKHLIDVEIDNRMRPFCRTRKMTVTTAYNADTQLVGVSEAVGKEIKLPVFGSVDVSKLTVGTAVWVFAPYSSMSNAMVFMLGDGETGYAANSGELGGKAPEYYVQPRNLLDNSDFTNPVNQRGKTIIETAGSYWLDRWITTANGYYELKDTSIGINSNQSAVSGIEQKLANPTHFTGKTLTIAVFARAVSSNAEMRLCFPYVGEVRNVPLFPEFRIYTYTTVFQANNAGNSVAIFAETGSAIEVAWAALYEGTYTAETLPPYMPKGYAVEWVECRRYYKRLIGDPILSGYIATATTRIFFVYPEWREMRTTPTVNALNSLSLTINGAYYNAELVSASLGNSSYLDVRYVGTQNTQNKVPCIISMTAPNNVLEFNADL